MLATKVDRSYFFFLFPVAVFFFVEGPSDFFAADSAGVLRKNENPPSVACSYKTGKPVRGHTGNERILYVFFLFCCCAQCCVLFVISVRLSLLSLYLFIYLFIYLFFFFKVSYLFIRDAYAEL